MRKIAYPVIIILLIGFISCKSLTSPDPESGVSNIAGLYLFEFTYKAKGTGISYEKWGSIDPIEITQDDTYIKINDCEGSIDKDDNLAFEGALLPSGGTQKFTGKYNKNTKKITGAFTGTAKYEPTGQICDITPSSSSYTMTKK